MSYQAFPTSLLNEHLFEDDNEVIVMLRWLPLIVNISLFLPYFIAPLTDFIQSPAKQSYIFIFVLTLERSFKNSCSLNIFSNSLNEEFVSLRVASKPLISYL